MSKSKSFFLVFQVRYFFWPQPVLLFILLYESPPTQFARSVPLPKELLDVPCPRNEWGFKLRIRNLTPNANQTCKRGLREVLTWYREGTLAHVHSRELSRWADRFVRGKKHETSVFNRQIISSENRTFRLSCNSVRESAGVGACSVKNLNVEG